MATSGSFRTYGYSDYGFPDRYVFSWSLVSQSIEGNYSDISWKLYGDGDNSSGNFTIVKEKYVTVNGSTQSNASEQHTYNGTTPFSGTARIYHNADGTGSFSASAGGAFFYYGSYNSTGSGSWSLPTIPRASSVSGGSGNIGGTTTINISRASSSFTHTLEYAFGSLSGTIATGVGTSYTWTIPTSFYTQIPNENSGTGTITCKTYNGSTLIGTKTCSFTANVTNSNPTVGTFTYKDSNSVTTEISENNQRIIRNNSNLLFTIGSATAKNSATISKYEITFNGVTKSRTSAGDLDFGNINLSNNANATLKVTDSRGNTATKNITIIIDDWVLPTALISVKRKNNYYSETYIKVDGSYSSLNGKNSMGIQYQYKKVSDKNFSEFYNLEDNVETTVSLDNEYQWNISVVITDRIGQTTYNLVLDRGMPIIFFDRLKNSVGINGFPKNEKSIEENGKQMFGMETGTWTPIISALNESDPTVTYTAQRGSYTKIGKMVWIDFYLRGEVTKLNGTNNYGCIKGLPFTAKDYNMGEQSFPIGVIYNLTTNTSDLTMGINSQAIRIQTSNGSGASVLKTSAGSGQGYFVIGASGWYEAS